MGIQEQVAADYKDRFAIPNSEGPEPEKKGADVLVHKRSRSDTVPKPHSQDSYTHNQSGKKTRLYFEALIFFLYSQNPNFILYMRIVASE